MSDRTIIALDAGRSAIKAVAFADGKKYPIVIPSIVAKAESVSSALDAKEAEIETVDVDGVKLFCGETARIISGATMTTGLSDQWIFDTEYRALCLAVVKRLAHLGVPGLYDPLIVVGTPADLFEVQRYKLEEVTSSILPGKVIALSQPMGAYFSYVMDERGVPIRERGYRENGAKRSWAVIEIGHYTSDFLFIREGRNIDSKASSCGGMNGAADRLKSILTKQQFTNQTPLKCQTSLATKTARKNGIDVDISNFVSEAIAYVAYEITNLAKSNFSKEMDDLDGILLAGGGASLLYDHLKKSLRNVVLLEEPRMAVAEGYLRFAKGYFLQESRKNKSVVETNA
ncbi:hypothetical protein ACFQUU_25210 [Herbaspirillum sp. GCM10030257]|uniref:ParM/StbA family protein n=1 Tax=Herbaspirillum sp. GCM10030257 TaxID=3273393 RepID=UPI003617E6AD